MLMPRQRGIPADRDEIKSQHSVTLGPTAWDGLKALADKHGYKSRSELLEAIGRGEIELTIKEEKPD